MVAPLKAGLAGLGTVGSAVVRLIERQRDLIAVRCGRPIEVVAVAARSPDKRRDLVNDLRLAPAWMRPIFLELAEEDA